jgi:flagellar operon protein
MEKSIFRPMPSQQLSQPILDKKHQRPITNTFSQHLQNSISLDPKLSLSKHAKERLAQRGIEIDHNQWTEIENKVAEAKKMGVKDSLVLLQNAALIISAKNNTVITAMGRNEASSQIFTNINGAIIIDS